LHRDAVRFTVRVPMTRSGMNDSPRGFVQRIGPPVRGCGPSRDSVLPMRAAAPVAGKGEPPTILRYHLPLFAIDSTRLVPHHVVLDLKFFCP
jgi:hypothetical protein